MIYRLFVLLLLSLTAFIFYISAYCVAYIYISPLLWVGEKPDDGVNLIGEGWIDSSTATSFADSMLQEAADIWAQPDEDWYTYTNRSSGSMVIQSRTIGNESPFNTSGVLLTRGQAILSGSNAKEIYNFLVSPEGFGVIDPQSDPKDFSEYAEQFKYRKGGRLEVAHIFASIFANNIQFCVLNAFATKQKVFVAKSISHESCPGTSTYGDNPADDKMMRAMQVTRGVNTFAFRTTDIKGNGPNAGKVLFEMINYLDTGIFKLPINYINVAVFLQGIIGRLQTAMNLAVGDVEEDWMKWIVKTVTTTAQQGLHYIFGEENVKNISRSVQDRYDSTNQKLRDLAELIRDEGKVKKDRSRGLQDAWSEVTTRRSKAKLNKKKK